MKLSTFQLVLLIVFGVAGFLGIFAFATFNSNGTANVVGSVTIWGSIPADEFNAALANITKTDKTLKGVIYKEHDAATIKSDLTSAIATGNAPDLVLITQEDLYSLGSVLTPIPAATLPASSFNKAFVQEAQLFENANGAYGVPFLVDPLVLYANRDILSSNGVAQPPSTWEAINGLTPKITTLTPAGDVTRSMIALGTYDNVQNARGILSTLFLQLGVPLSVMAQSGLMSASLGNQTAQNGQPPGQAVLSFYTQFADPSKQSYTWNGSLANSQRAFLDGDLALYLGYASEAAYFTQANPNLNFIVAPMPQPQVATTKTTYGLVYAFATPHGAQNAAGGYQAAVLLSNLTQQQAMSQATGLAPASLTALSSLTGNPVLDVAYTSALYAKGWLSPAPSDTDQVFSSMINNVISGRYTLETALSVAEQSISALLRS